MNVHLCDCSGRIDLDGPYKPHMALWVGILKRPRVIHARTQVVPKEFPFLAAEAQSKQAKGARKTGTTIVGVGFEQKWRVKVGAQTSNPSVSS